MSQPYRVTIANGIAEMILDQPPVNAFDSGGWFAIARQLEALGADDGGEFGLQDLEGDLALVLEIVGEVDGRHAALAQLALEVVAAFEGCVQALHRGGAHVWPSVI